MTTPHDTQEPQTDIATKQTKHGVIIVDECDADLLAKCVASETSAGYPYARVYRSEGGKTITAYLHRVILARILGREPVRAENVDHANHNTLDCRRANLRVATPAQNHGNQKLYSNNRSGFKGVYWRKAERKWCAQIKRNGKSYRLGLFTDPAEAHDAYMIAARAYFGEFANNGRGDNHAD